ncbi:MAG TPA: dihydrodipicolinate synthase family protein [Stenotrophomonas sp.]|nr:dihydrodipicolinate synthase family protein [Stenotrophomonas sp.]
MQTGLCAFPLTPMVENRPDLHAFAHLVSRLDRSEVDSICVLGSTGSYAYLRLDERKLLARIAAEQAGDTPLVVGVGALSERDVLELMEDAQNAGAQGLLLAPVSYQPLTDDEVFGLYARASSHSSVPICVYDNPATTHFTFSDALYARIAALPRIGSIKIPGLPVGTVSTAQRISHLRSTLPNSIALGISGDASAARGLIAGCDVWYSVIGGLFPDLAAKIVQAARAGDHERANAASTELSPLWHLFDQHGGSIRVVAAAAELLGLCEGRCLPAPLVPLAGDDQLALRIVLRQLRLL